MLEKILVALDRSEMGQEVFQQALSLAKVMSAQLLLLHVLSPEEEGSPYIPMLSNVDYYPGLSGQSLDLYQKQWDSFKDEGVRMLQAFCAQANLADVKAEFSQVLGNPGNTICKMAAEWNADLIVMGHRGRSGLAEFFLGSVSNYVLHHANYSVYIVHYPRNLKSSEKTVVEAAENVSVS
ncbi:universal stress protein [Nostoc sp. PCC 7107]|uniref:universal stress protein n=1 Tax=Nostoc sp. PCC 7107 TaxID=317936 RepID=UPI00029ED605|nr:universal stress protein [Nostoc sp. PCC 7107]AFY42977.1 UspA domain-containing protein [Nostoc sp. PCC 7107]